MKGMTWEHPHTFTHTSSDTHTQPHQSYLSQRILSSLCCRASAVASFSLPAQTSRSPQPAVCPLSRPPLQSRWTGRRVSCQTEDTAAVAAVCGCGDRLCICERRRVSSAECGWGVGDGTCHADISLVAVKFKPSLPSDTLRHVHSSSPTHQSPDAYHMAPDRRLWQGRGGGKCTVDVLWVTAHKFLSSSKFFSSFHLNVLSASVLVTLEKNSIIVKAQCSLKECVSPVRALIQD